MQKCTQEICSKSSFQLADSVILCYCKAFAGSHSLESRSLLSDIIFVQEEELTAANDGCMLRCSHQLSSRGPIILCFSSSSYAFRDPVLFPVLCFSPSVIIEPSYKYMSYTNSPSTGMVLCGFGQGSYFRTACSKTKLHKWKFAD